MTTQHRKLSIKTLVTLVIAAAIFSAAAQTARADDPEFDAIANHLKSYYNARRVHIPLMNLAHLFVHFAKPAGVKSFKVAIFEHLNFTEGKTDTELGALMRNALNPEWQPLARVRTHDGEQVYVYAREDGANVKLMVVTIDHDEAVVARVKFSPEKLAEFLNDPKIMGIRVGG